LKSHIIAVLILILFVSCTKSPSNDTGKPSSPDKREALVQEKKGVGTWRVEKPQLDVPEDK
jgi:hypothetical protein